VRSVTALVRSVTALVHLVTVLLHSVTALVRSVTTQVQLVTVLVHSVTAHVRLVTVLLHSTTRAHTCLAAKATLTPIPSLKLSFKQRLRETWITLQLNHTCPHLLDSQGHAHTDAIPKACLEPQSTA